MPRHKHADVIIAWANGEEVQREGSDGWFWGPHLGEIPNFNDGNWRIKPKIVKKEGWVNVYSVDNHLECGIVFGVYKRKETADNHADSGRVGCIRIEWEEKDE